MVSTSHRAAAGPAVAPLMFLEHEKKTFFSLPATTRSGGVGQGRASFARRAAVGA